MDNTYTALSIDEIAKSRVLLLNVMVLGFALMRNAWCHKTISAHVAVIVASAGAVIYCISALSRLHAVRPLTIDGT